MSRAIKIIITEEGDYNIDYLTQTYTQHEDISLKTYKRNEILEIIETGKYQFVLLDYSGNENEGQKLLKHLKLKMVKTPIIVFTNPNSNHNIILTQNDWMVDKTGVCETPDELINLLRKFIKNNDNLSQ